MKLIKNKVFLIILSCLISVSIIAWLIWSAKDNFFKNEQNNPHGLCEESKEPPHQGFNSRCGGSCMSIED